MNMHGSSQKKYKDRNKIEIQISLPFMSMFTNLFSITNSCTYFNVFYSIAGKFGEFDKWTVFRQLKSTKSFYLVQVYLAR